MECKTTVHSEDFHNDHKTNIKGDDSQDNEATKSQKSYLLQKGTNFEEYVWKNDLDTKIGIKEETWDTNAVSGDIKSDPLALHTEPFLSLGTTKGVNKLEIKEEYLNTQEISSESQTDDLFQNEACFVECFDNRDVDTKIGTKQEIWDTKHVVKSYIKSSPDNPLTSLGTGIIKEEDDIHLKEDSWWVDRTSPDSQNEEKESDTEKIEASKQPLTLEPPRLLDLEKDDASYQRVYDKNANQGTSIRQSISSLNCNSLSASDNFESEPNNADEKTQVFECENCGKCFRHKSSLQRHSLLHTGIKPHKCEVCEKVFTHISRLKIHKLTHTGTKPYKCDTCEKYFTRKSYLQTHKLLHSDSKRYQCDMCKKGFRKKSYLQYHKLRHSGLTPYKCGRCEKCFTQNSDLKRHEVLHTGTKPHKCDKCDKCFIHKSDLRTHTLLHSGIKAHKCEVCDKCFTRNSYLQCHKLSHSAGSKLYKCKFCEKTFLLISELKMHKLIHTGTKPYICDICEKRFTQKLNLKTHALAHSGIKPNQCNVCGKCFTWKSSLARHTSLH